LQLCIHKEKHLNMGIISKDLSILYSKSYASNTASEDESQQVEEILEYILSVRNDLASRVPSKFFTPFDHDSREKTSLDLKS